MIDIFNVLAYVFTFGYCGSLCLIGFHVWKKNLDTKELRCSECGKHEK